MISSTYMHAVWHVCYEFNASEHIVSVQKQIEEQRGRTSSLVAEYSLKELYRSRSKAEKIEKKWTVVVKGYFPCFVIR